jgi:hypothetical protein
MENTFKLGARVKHQSDNDELVYGEVVEVGEDLLFVQWEDLTHPSSYKLDDLEGIEPA